MIGVKESVVNLVRYAVFGKLQLQPTIYLTVELRQIRAIRETIRNEFYSKGKDVL